jgi:hypothetical protein
VITDGNILILKPFANGPANSQCGTLLALFRLMTMGDEAQALRREFVTEEKILSKAQ